VTRSRAVPTPYGDGRLDVHAARHATVTLLLSHGAGNGVEARDLAALAGALPRQGASVALFEQPWRVAGRKIASPPPTLDVGLRAAHAALRPRGPLVVGGRSAGARSAVRCATDLGAAGCLALAFPLHPPGRLERSRAGELTAVAVPVLVVQGERDPFGGPHDVAAAAPGVTVSAVPGDHSLKQALDALPDAVVPWLAAF
jgi:uncharacterized protein